MTYLLLYNKNKFMRKEKYTDEVLKQLAEKKRMVINMIIVN